MISGKQNREQFAGPRTRIPHGRLVCAVAALSMAGAVAVAQNKPQFQQPASDPLARMREAAAANAQACSATGVSACAEAAPKIVAAALGASPMAENLRRLTDEIGGRMTGTPEMARAVDWAVAGFHEAGTDSVRTEPFTVPITWSEGDSRLALIAPSPALVRVTSVAWSPATPPGGIEADVVDAAAGEASDFASIGSAARGAILLLHSDVPSDRTELEAAALRRRAVIARAIAAESSAILWESGRPDLLLDREMNQFDGSLDRLPQAVVSREDAERLARELAAGKKLRARLDLPNRIGGPAGQENVVAEIRGREKPEDFVVLGAGLDSWDLGGGALDGSDAALVIEAARDIRLTGLRPRRSIRFVLFGGSRQGMLGSRAYVLAHGAELDHAVAALFFENGSGRVTGFSLSGRRDTEPELREALAPLGWGPARNTEDAPLGYDSLGFLLEGVPVFVANQQPGSYLPAYGTAADTYDKVNLLDLKLNTAVAGLLAFSFAELPSVPGPHLSRTDVQAILNQTGLAARMKAAGLSNDEPGQAGPGRKQ